MEIMMIDNIIYWEKTIRTIAAGAAAAAAAVFTVARDTAEIRHTIVCSTKQPFELKIPIGHFLFKSD